MAKMPPKKSEDGGGEWLNTYADMVTLLLTFFVLLFACSNLDETKVQYILQAFQSRGRYINTVVAEQDPMAEENGGTTDNKDDIGGEGSMPQSFDELYQFLADYVDMNNLSETVALEQGAAHLTIRFDDSVFFDGNSYILKTEGKELLDGIIPALQAIQNSIRTATVAGHTAYVPASDSKINDFWLSSERAVAVVNYLNLKNTMEETKYRVKGCGYAEPIADVDTLEGQRKNRRVEIMILKNELDLTDSDVLKDILEHDFSLGAGAFDPENQTPPDTSTLPEGSADRIIGFIDSKFGDSDVTQVGIVGPGSMDINDFIASDDTEGGDTDDAGGEDVEES